MFGRMFEEGNTSGGRASKKKESRGAVLARRFNEGSSREAWSTVFHNAGDSRSRYEKRAESDEERDDDIESMNPEQLYGFLSQNGVPEAARDVLLREEVDGSTLLGMETEDLKDLGIKFGHQKKLARFIQSAKPAASGIRYRNPRQPDANSCPTTSNTESRSSDPGLIAIAVIQSFVESMNKQRDSDRVWMEKQQDKAFEIYTKNQKEMMLMLERLIQNSQGHTNAPPTKPVRKTPLQLIVNPFSPEVRLDIRAEGQSEVTTFKGDDCVDLSGFPDGKIIVKSSCLLADTGECCDTGAYEITKSGNKLDRPYIDLKLQRITTRVFAKDNEVEGVVNGNFKPTASKKNYKVKRNANAGGVPWSLPEGDLNLTMTPKNSGAPIKQPTITIPAPVPVDKEEDIPDGPAPCVE